jgi:hypothetical protein
MANGREAPGITEDRKMHGKGFNAVGRALPGFLLRLPEPANWPRRSRIPYRKRLNEPESSVKAGGETSIFEREDVRHE